MHCNVNCDRVGAEGGVARFDNKSRAVQPKGCRGENPQLGKDVALARVNANRKWDRMCLYQVR